MPTIVGVRFRDAGKVYYFDPEGTALRQGQYVVAATVRGVECGEVMIANQEVDEASVKHPLRSIVRVATEEDIARKEENRQKEREAAEVALRKIGEHNLEMKLVDVECSFDRSKLLFYFTADGRVDFRALVKDLASVFHTRIELRQIGVRDEAKMLGGYGKCGEQLCCARFLGEFYPVSIKMAKEQGLSMNPAKMSGTCGRLMCCLKYEQDTYSALMEAMPRYGDTVDTPEGRGRVVGNHLIAGKVTVRMDKGGENAQQTFDMKDISPRAAAREAGKA